MEASKRKEGNCFFVAPNGKQTFSHKLLKHKSNVSVLSLSVMLRCVCPSALFGVSPCRGAIRSPFDRKCRDTTQRSGGEDLDVQSDSVIV